MYKNIIIATGSSPKKYEKFKVDNKIFMTTKEVMELEHIPNTLTIVGGGKVALELGSLFS